MTPIEIPRDGNHQGRRVILTTGGRDFNDRDWMFSILDTALQQCELLTVRLALLQGGAKGADAVARTWARFQFGDVDLITETAGQMMIDKYHPDYFIAMPGGRVTSDMVSRCRLAKMPGADFRLALPTDVNGYARPADGYDAG